MLLKNLRIDIFSGPLKMTQCHVQQHKFAGIGFGPSLQVQGHLPLEILNIKHEFLVQLPSNDKILSINSQAYLCDWLTRVSCK